MWLDGVSTPAKKALSWKTHKKPLVETRLYVIIVDRGRINLESLALSLDALLFLFS